eukprot:scaffold92056_cov36-Tisochrysis_lutea.AAC.1
MNNIWLHTSTNDLDLGETTRRHHDGRNDREEEEVTQHHTPAKWENGYKGPKHMEYPLADEHSIQHIAKLYTLPLLNIPQKEARSTQGPQHSPTEKRNKKKQEAVKGHNIFQKKRRNQPEAGFEPATAS